MIGVRPTGRDDDSRPSTPSPSSPHLTGPWSSVATCVTPGKPSSLSERGLRVCAVSHPACLLRHRTCTGLRLRSTPPGTSATDSAPYHTHLLQILTVPSALPDTTSWNSIHNDRSMDQQTLLQLTCPRTPHLAGPKPGHAEHASRVSDKVPSHAAICRGQGDPVVRRVCHHLLQLLIPSLGPSCRSDQKALAHGAIPPAWLTRLTTSPCVGLVLETRPCSGHVYCSHLRAAHSVPSPQGQSSASLLTPGMHLAQIDIA